MTEELVLYETEANIATDTLLHSVSVALKSS